MSETEPEILRLGPNGWVPNNDRLPTLLYRRAVADGAGDIAAAMEAMFDRCGWPAQPSPRPARNSRPRSVTATATSAITPKAA